MKKFYLLAIVALLVAGSAMAQVVNGPSTIDNYDSCDISVSPSATLLLPYFEVDYANADRTTALDTAFTITNVSNTPAIAHVTVWTDWSFPVLDFNIFLTGYDVQGVSLYDILNRGLLPATSNASAKGSRSLSNTTGNTHFLASAAAACTGLPGPIPTALLNAVRAGLTGGDYGVGALSCGQVGGVHTNAVGYVTVDTAATCSQTLPTTASYYSGEILFDNQLIGDFLRLAPSTATGNYAGGNPMVHIKAIPGGGPAGGAGITTNLPWTFYDRYTDHAVNAQADRRQPLPSLFAARFIAEGFNTRFVMWREGIVADEDCTAIDYSENGNIPYTEFVRFDEHENGTTITASCQISPCPPGTGLPETSAPSITDAIFPPRASGSTDVGGWMYMNLDNPDSVDIFSDPLRPSQNWVVIEMTAEGRYGVDFDAAYLANGCTNQLPAGAIIGPQFGANTRLLFP